jgi:ParB family chromosome partitioning protein
MAKNKSGLGGMGLDALLKVNVQNNNSSRSEESAENVLAGFAELPIDKIVPNNNQPRKYFDDEKIEELTISVKTFGVIEPITVVKKDDKYEIVAGERRYRASIRAGLEKIPVMIRDLSQKEQLEISLVENIQREDLNPIEEALAYTSLINAYNITHDDISKRVGKSRPAITNTIRLLNLEPQIQKWIIEGGLSQGHARAILSIEDKNEHIKFADYIMKNNLSVREADNLSKKWITPTKNEKEENASKPKLREIEIQDAEDRLSKKLQTKVKINGTSIKGKIVIDYFTQEDLERILEIFE